MFGWKKAAPAGADGRNILGSLLLVVDGSEPSIAAADFAVALAGQTGSRITAIYVVDTATMDYLLQMRILIRDEREEFESDLERTGARYLEYVAAIAGKHGIEAETRLRRGRFHTTILREAQEIEADAVVLGGWRRTVTRKDANSVERQLILDQADCPVIVVKSEEQRRGRND